ncbi:hypothetical protein CHARACLAT_030007 [Characodon lateralis]|uniref:Ankyrin repeat domain 9 n=1 Tax=Characodon lateralis TaxID=208331 RepID=A0ABU7DXG8_9TELE|nr:hypothetical protein [Characodon lateralis]
MPRLRSSSECLSLSPCQRECERTAFSFYCAVREQLPVWLLEEMRSMEVFCWDNGSPRAFLPSEALLYAIVHDHQDYGRYLLNRYSVGALRAPSCSFCCCPGSGTPHLNVAVRYNRVAILSMMMEALKDCAGLGKRREYLDGCGGCVHAADAGKTAVQLAVELSHSDCLLQLLVHDARPDGLESKPPLLPCLQDEPQRWQGVLGNRVFSWLCGLTPSPLLLQALRCLAQSGSDCITSLPDFLQPHS